MTSFILSWLSKYWVYLALGGAAFLWLRQHDAKVRYQVQSEERQKQVDLMVKSLDSANQALVKKDSMLQEKANRIRVQDSLSVLRTARARQQTDKALEDLRSTLNDEQQVQLSKVVEGFNKQISGLQEQVEHGAALLALSEQKVSARDSLISVLNERVDSITTMYFAAEKRAAGSGSLGAKLTKWLPWAIAGAVVLTR